MNCKNWKCDGFLTLQCPHTKKETWIPAHKLPIFLQCNTCDYAPSPEEQPALIKQWLELFLEQGGDMELMTQAHKVKNRADDQWITRRIEGKAGGGKKAWNKGKKGLPQGKAKRNPGGQIIG